MTASIKRTCESLVAGSIIYAAMTACSGGSGAVAGGPMNGTGGSDDVVGGQPAVVAGSTSEAGTVPVAMAAGTGGVAPTTECDCEPVAPVEPTIVEATCSIQRPTGAMFAEAAFPGKTALELAKVVAIVEFDHEIASKYPAGAPEGYSLQLSNVLLRDGFAATSCGTIGQEHVATTVRFVLP